MSVITLTVDEARRALSASDTNAFVINDKNVDVVRFALLTGFADIALDEHSALRVMYQRPGETEVRAQTLTYYDTDGIHNFYDWELLSADLAEKGTLTVALCILRTDGDVEEWHTTPYQIRVLGSIHTDDSDEGDETITPTVAQRVAVLETMIQRVASGAPVVVSSVAEMTDTAQIYVLTTDGKWYYHNGSAWVAGGEYGAVSTDRTLSTDGIPADAKAVGKVIDNINNILKNIVVNESALAEFIDNTDIDYAFDEATDANYSVIRVYKHKIDGTEQYPFVYAPKGAGSGDQSTMELMQNEAWLLAINAGIFDMTHCTPDGIVVENGKVIKNAVSATSPQCKPLTIDADGNLGYAAYDANANTLVSQGIISAVCGFMPIIVDYDPVPQSEWNNVAHYTQNAQRQIIGQFGNGDYAIVTCEGRNFNNSDGWTIAEAQTICQKIGLKFAYNLDGGGSTETMIGKYPVNTVYEGTKGRKVPTFIVFNGKDSFSIPTIKRVTGISLMSHAGTINEGESITLEAVVYPTDATDKSITWSSSDPSIASVSGGIIRGIAEGTATITATTNDGGYTDTFTVTVKSSIVLPTGYKRVQYVQADGRQYIDTGIAETANLGAEYTYSIDADSPYGTGNHILSSQNYFYPFLRSTSDTTNRDLIVTTRGQSGGQEFNCSWSLGTKYTFKSFVGSNDFYVNGSRIGALATGSNLSAAKKLTLFAYGGNPTGTQYTFKGKLYSMTLFDSNSNVVHRYIPCINPDGVAGLYDVVDQKFLKSNAPKELIAGEEVDPGGDDDPVIDGNVFTVTVTMTTQTIGTADKTYAEVYQAWIDGKVIRLNVPAMNAEINIIARSFIGEDNEMFTTYIKDNENIIGGAIVKNGEDKMTAVLF